jgi:hypothetical protein
MCDLSIKRLLKTLLLPNSNQGLILFTNSDNGTNIYLNLITEFLRNTGKRIIEIEIKTGYRKRRKEEDSCDFVKQFS